MDGFGGTDSQQSTKVYEEISPTIPRAIYHQMNMSWIMMFETFAINFVQIYNLK